MQTKLPIITLQECREIYHGPLSDARICTFDRSQRRATCVGDEGGPLVYDNRLLGILLFIGGPSWVNPDIFINFNDPLMHRLVNYHVNELRVIH